MAISKIVGSFDEAVADIHDGAVLLIGGFGGPGECPSYLIAAVARKAVKNVTIVGNSGGWGPEPHRAAPHADGQRPAFSA